jgi:hypothetical protein
LDFSNEILMLELVLCEPLYSIEKAFWDREKVEEVKESFKWLLEGLDDRCPSGMRIILKLDFE